jgi:hypothetical protein
VLRKKVSVRRDFLLALMALSAALGANVPEWVRPLVEVVIATI